MTNETVVSELRNTYSESIRRTSHFIASALTILFILAIIVQLELIQIQSQAQVLRRDVLGVTKRLDSCAKTLSEMHVEFRRALDKVMYSDTFLTLNRIDGSDDPLLKPEDLEDLTRLEKKLYQVKEEISKPSQAAISQEQYKKIEEIQSEIVNWLLKVEKVLHEHKNSGASTTKASAKTVQKLATDLNLYAENLKLYKEKYGVCLSLKQSTQSPKRVELREMSSKRQSIPTPFGDFEIAPKLALMALAFGSVFTYLAFLVSIVKTRQLVEDYLLLHLGKEPIPLDHAPPFWLHGGHGRNFAAVYRNKAPSKLLPIANAALHLGWILFTGWLIYKSLALKSANVLLSEYRKFADYTLLVIFFVAIAFAVALFYSRFLNGFRSEQGKLLESGRISGRRIFLGLSVTGLLTGAAYYFWIKSAGLKSKQRVSKPSLSLPTHYEEFVGNRKTKVLHHLTACRKHLPLKKNRVVRDESLISFCPHVSNGARILEEVAITEIAGKNYGLAVSYLRKAIELNPLGYHLYDRLIGLYGRLRQYDEIKLLLTDALHVQNLAKQNLEIGGQDTWAKRIKRAENEFNLRLEVYNDKAHKKA